MLSVTLASGAPTAESMLSINALTGLECIKCDVGVYFYQPVNSIYFGP